jgi:hypothetical protein
LDRRKVINSYSQPVNSHFSNESRAPKIDMFCSADKSRCEMRIENIKRAELTVSILLTLTVALLLLVRTTHAGALWRDECGALQLARMPTVSDIAASFQHEAFPPPFPLTLRGYTNLLGANDIALRIFGFAVGVALLLVAWINSRLIGERVPLIFLALIGLNTTFLSWGTSLRAYGIGSVLIALAFGFAARLLVDPAPRWILAAFLAFVACAQYLINDIVLVFSIAAAAMAVCLIRKHPKLAIAFLSGAALCALSVVPYLKSYADSADWNSVLQYPGHSDWLLGNLNFALGAPFRFMPWIWYFLVALAIGGAAWRLRIIWPEKSATLLLFGILVAIISVVAYYIFLRRLSYVTQPWYYLAPLFVLAAALDLIVAQLSQIAWIRVARLGLVAAFLIALPLAAWPIITKRQTNIDVVAQKLTDATANDLIVVNPWITGVSFNWYYHGAAPWLTVPTMNEHRVHRYDLLKAKMISPQPLEDLFGAIRSTLQSGNRLWLVGGAEVLPEGQVPLALPPAPNSQFGWESDAYLVSWSQELASFVRKHAVTAQIILPPNPEVNDLENVPLWLAQGWKD